MALTVLSLCFSNLQYWFLDTGLILRSQYDDNSLIFIPFEFLILPFFYLFVRAYINKSIRKDEVIFLFLPFILSLTYVLIRNNFSDSISVIKLFNLIVEYVSLFFTIAIIVLIFKILLSHEKSQFNYQSQKVPIKIGWLKRLLFIGILLCCFWFVSLNVFGDIFGSGYYKFYPLWIGVSVLIYWIAYASIFQSNIYKERLLIRERHVLHNDDGNAKRKTNQDKYQDIYDVIISKRLFLNSKMSLSLLSKELNISESYLSQIINQNSGKNYSTIINELRVEYAKKLLLDKEYSNYTITALGLESGFNTKTSFYSIFKKHTGKTPNEYKKSVQNY
uniref:AraC family transcriptional regulator n=1 Tax=Hyunsoonleella pacifica TaxID=1080224 RepID=A0A4Q9FP62_9FLAO|nr:AraC family transcriptional regulator [Hyunsoonleella pacifica]